MRRALVLASTALIAVALAGCGAGDSQDAGATALTIEVLPGGAEGADAVVATLRCDPPSGDLDDPAAACAALEEEAVRTALEPVPPNTACTLLWGGPETARIRGTLDGLEIDASLSRGNGCEIARWDALAPVLPAYEPLGVG